MSSTGKHNLCEVFTSSRLSYCLWDREKKNKILYQGVSDTLFHPGAYTGTTQETSEGFSWQKQLNNLKASTMGCLHENPSQKSN